MSSSLSSDAEDLGGYLKQADIGTRYCPTPTTTSEEYAHEIYRGVAGNEDIEAFLHQNDAFDIENRLWAVSQSPETPESLFSSVYTIVFDVLNRFVKSAQPGVARTVAALYYGSQNGETDHIGDKMTQFLAVQAVGPSFERPVPPDNSFSNIASFIAVKFEEEVKGVKETVKEMEPCAMRIFDEQPNRLFVRSLVVTEKHVQLVHFDRAGVEATPLIDIHAHPATLIRFIAGLATTDERLLGFDDSIQWTKVNGGKDEGTVTTIGPTGEPRTYPILERIPIGRNGIVGRGTNCWRVQDPDTLEELVINDSWRPDDAPPEHDLLKLVDGLPGVVQMVSYELGRGETNDFRCPSNAGKCHNRAAMRTTMKSYGQSIDFFTSIPQVLCAIRDAIAGHQRLLGDGLRILHRDISHNNILIGAEGAPEGHRGILIDLDIAFRATDSCPTVAIDNKIGTRIFQSLSVLASYYGSQDQLPPHDYLDDLESFLFVLVYTFLIHNPDGSRVSSKEVGPSLIGGWDHPDPKIAWSRKEAMLGGAEDARVARIVEGTWGPQCGRLYRQFSYLMTEWTEDKLALLKNHKKQNRPMTVNPFEELHSHCDEHYAQILSLFDEIIDEVNMSALQEPPESAKVSGMAPSGKGPRSLPPFVPSGSPEPSSSLPAVSHSSPGASIPLISVLQPLPPSRLPAAPGLNIARRRPAHMKKLVHANGERYLVPSVNAALFQNASLSTSSSTGHESPSRVSPHSLKRCIQAIDSPESSATKVRCLGRGKNSLPHVF